MDKMKKSNTYDLNLYKWWLDEFITRTKQMVPDSKYTKINDSYTIYTIIQSRSHKYYSSSASIICFGRICNKRYNTKDILCIQLDKFASRLQLICYKLKNILYVNKYGKKYHGVFVLISPGCIDPFWVSDRSDNGQELYSLAIYRGIIILPLNIEFTINFPGYKFFISTQKEKNS